VLLQSGDKFPITSSLNSLQGRFFTDYNLLSAGSVLAMLPVLAAFSSSSPPTCTTPTPHTRRERT
jgi:ABC-type glycerol-3-phosphate transport system permease component